MPYTPALHKSFPLSSHQGYSRSSIIFLCLLFVAALLIRIQFVKLSTAEIFIARDAKQYVQYAKNLVDHGVYSKAVSNKDLQPDSLRSPGYPLVIALALMAAGGPKFLPVVLYVQALTGALMVPLTFYTGIFFMPAIAALMAAMLVAFSPHLVTIAGCVLTESQFAFLLLGAVCSIQYALSNRNTILFILSALLFGGTYLTNETALFLPYLIVIIFLILSRTNFMPRQRMSILPRLVLFLSIFTIFPIGWSLRNNINVPQGAPKGSDRAIVTLSHGAYPDFIFKSQRYQRFPYREDPEQPEFGSSLNSFIRILGERVRSEPLRYAKWYMAGKPYYLWSWDIIQGVGDIYIYPVKTSLFQISSVAGFTRSVMRYLHPVLVVLALAGIPLAFILYRLNKNAGILLKSAWLPMSVCIYFTLVYTVFAPWPRYSIPLRPELYLCSLWTLSIFISLILKQGRWGNGKPVF